MIIKFYDNEKYDYPLLSIFEKDFEKFKIILKEYQKDEEYNFDDFLDLLLENGIKYKFFEKDVELFF